jgi:1,2-dihydroxy-3-keto-5-methylthiopentene dioxygenase
MSLLISWPEDGPGEPLLQTSDPVEIAAGFRGFGCRFERRKINDGLAPGATAEEVLAAYRDLIDAEVAAAGFVTVDVAGIAPGDHGYPERAKQVRAMFIDEHTHGEDDEVRFITRGSGAFYLHIGGKVHAIVAEAGDLTGVPRGTAHWFDAGARPDFTAIRFFHNPEGWVGLPTGNAISGRFPDFDELRAQAGRPGGS